MLKVTLRVMLHVGLSVALGVKPHITLVRTMLLKNVLRLSRKMLHRGTLLFYCIMHGENTKNM